MASRFECAVRVGLVFVVRIVTAWMSWMGDSPPLSLMV